LIRNVYAHSTRRCGRVAWVAVLASAALAAGSAAAQPAAGGAPKPAQPPAWIARSNEHAQVLLQSLSKFAPEQASQFGVDGLDDQIMDLKPKVHERARKALVDARTELQNRMTAEKDPNVKQDLDIMIQASTRFIDASDLEEKLLLSYIDVPQAVFFGVRGLLDDQNDAKRYPAAVVRLKRYAGLESGYEPITKLAMDRTRERLANKALLGPIKAEVQKSLETNTNYIEGIGQLCQKFHVAGYEEPYAKLKEQLAAYETFVKQEIVPRCREDFRQPPELYAMSLREFGIDMPVDELTARARFSYMEIRNQMQALAPLVAKQKGFQATDYHQVIAELKKEQLQGDAILTMYQQRVHDMEDIIRRERIVTLPAREMRVRIATDAEAAATPAPNLHPPRLIGNTGEMGEFVLPLRVPGAKNLQFDDFTYAAESWTLTAHEGRPGHELQFASTVEKGVSVARSLFAFNSTNVEGWGLYAEAEAQPYEPLEGQLCTLQNRLMRAARAFLDPGLQTGTITRDEAFRILREEVCLSEAMATQEVERYTFRGPGQAPSYFCGYSRLLEIRADAERMLGRDFDRMAFNDFVLSQGLLPPSILRKAVMEDFVPSQKGMANRRGEAR
jgi:uncharacterized protein (DUF885 family)